MLVLCQRSRAARQNMVGYVFALATAGLAGVLYLAYASVVVLETVCLLCVGTYVAVVALFLVSGAADRQPMSGLPQPCVARCRARCSARLRLWPRPSRLSSRPLSAVMLFPGSAVSAQRSDSGAPAAGAAAGAAGRQPVATVRR